MKVSFNKQIKDSIWGGGNQMLKLLVDYFIEQGIDVSFTLDDDTDVIMAMDVRDKPCTFGLKAVQHAKERGVKVVHRVNDNGSHRKNDEKRDAVIINYNRSVADKTIFLSSWLKDYFLDRGLVAKGSSVVENGVDKEAFCRSDNERKIGAPLKIVTHHWSNNLAKGYLIYDQVDKFCHENPDVAHFRFFGQCPNGHLPYCEKLSPKPYSEVPTFLNTEHVYLTATQLESGGCHIVEGMSCGLIPMVMKGAGGPEEYASGLSMPFSKIDDLIVNIKTLSNDYDLYIKMKKQMNKYEYNSKDMCQAYLDVVKSLV